MSRRVLALPWVVGVVVLACGGERRDFGPQPVPEHDAGDESTSRKRRGDAGGATSGLAADAGASDVSATHSDVSVEAGTPTETGETSGATAESSDEITTPADVGPTLDGACTSGGVRACDVNDPKQTLVCSQGRWQSNGGCAKKDNCDPSVGACSEIITGCARLVDGARYCRAGDELWECGPNLVSETLVDTCEGNCVVDGETSKCVAPTCGDGKTQANELCDDANDDNEDACTILCKPPECGDGLQHSTELCDDGDDDEEDECTTLCAPPACGDGIAQSWEECDDGNTDEEACTSACELPKCGDGIVQSWEECDDGNTDEEACTSACELPKCGDGIVQSWEACDDGNTDYGDGCSHECRFEVVELVSGYYHTCARRADGRVKCWGYNPYGQLGIGGTAHVGILAAQMGEALPEVDLGTGRSALQLAAGFGHTCALLDNHRVKCWGANYAGQLGLGDLLARGVEPGQMGDALEEVDLGTDVTIEQLVAGESHTCALLTGGEVKCWGHNYYGQLGYGDTDQRGDALEEMGDALPAVDLGAGRTARKIAANGFHTCAILDNNELKCWGLNNSGQLGQGHADSIGFAAYQMGDHLPAIDLGGGRLAMDVAAGLYHVCALLDTSELKCWGYNQSGSLGYGDVAERGDAPGEMGDALPSVDVGYGRAVLAAALGASNTCALLDTYDVKCWGYGAYGVPGQGSLDTWGDEPDELGDFLPIVPLGSGVAARSVTLGSYHACALLFDGGVKCWGYNSEGELGQGHADYIGNDPDEMGDNLAQTILW